MLPDCEPYQSFYEVIVVIFTVEMLHLVEPVIFSKMTA